MRARRRAHWRRASGGGSATATACVRRGRRQRDRAHWGPRRRWTRRAYPMHPPVLPSDRTRARARPRARRACCGRHCAWRQSSARFEPSDDKTVAAPGRVGARRRCGRVCALAVPAIASFRATARFASPPATRTGGDNVISRLRVCAVALPLYCDSAFAPPPLWRCFGDRAAPALARRPGAERDSLRVYKLILYMT